MNTHYNAIVVGAGPGGSTAAALLAKAGKRVLLVDKNKSAGGRMMTIHDKEGFHYELFPINGCPAEGAQMDNVLKQIGKENTVKRINPKALGLADIMYMMDSKGKLLANEMGGMDLKTLRSLRISLFNPKHLSGLHRVKKLFEHIMKMPEDEIKELSMTSAADFVDRYGPFPGLFRTYLLFQCEGAFEMTCEKVAASELIRFARQAAAQGTGRYYEYGFGRVFEICAEAVEEFGGTVLFNTRVKSINTEDGIAKGITLQSGEVYTADLVLSDAGIRQTVHSLVGDDKYESEYIDRIKSLEPNLACVGYRWFLDAPVLKSPMIVVFPEGGLDTFEEFKAKSEVRGKEFHNYVYFGTTSLYPNTAPKGKQLVYAVMSCYPNPELNMQPHLDYIESIVRKIQPDLFSHIYRTELMTPAQCAAAGTDKMGPDLGGEAYGVANSVGQSGDQRPSPVSPIRNLYYVGNDAGGFGMGTNQAVDSAINVVQMILGQ